MATPNSFKPRIGRANMRIPYISSADTRTLLGGYLGLTDGQNGEKMVTSTHNLQPNTLNSSQTRFYHSTPTSFYHDPLSYTRFLCSSTRTYMKRQYPNSTKYTSHRNKSLTSDSCETISPRIATRSKA